MADERYQWLDQEAAERLLRGLPVDAVDDATRSGVRRLADALDTARTPAAAPDPGAELPGEAAALAAFREATAERAAAATAAGPAPVAPGDLGRVRLAPVVVPARRWGRSVRYGLAAAVAAVTVGGVAVAAGTGVLPLVGPGPASSVTAQEIPEPVATGTGTPAPRRDPDEVPPAVPETGGPTPGPSVSGTPGVGTPPPTGSPDASGTVVPRPGRTTTAPGGGTDATGGTGSSVLPEQARKAACLDYRAGRLDAARRKQLVSSVPTGETLRRYCDRLLSVDTGAADGVTPGDSAGSGGSRGSTGGAGGGPGGSGESKDDDGKDDDPKDDAGRAAPRTGAPDGKGGGAGTKPAKKEKGVAGKRP